MRKVSGIVVEDVDGNRFVDFMSGIAVSLTEHCHPEVVQAIRRQAESMLHIRGSDFYYEAYTELCTRLAALAPGSEPWRVYLGNSGAEAVEAAVKLARFLTQRPYLNLFYGAFHGRTYGAMSLTASKVAQRAGFGPHLPGVYHVPYGACGDCAGGRVGPGCGPHAVECWAEDLFTRLVDPLEVAAVIVEPIQGEAGHRMPSKDYFPKLRRLCDDHGILLIAEEIQTGMGRTGTFFALEQWNVVPDIITLAKGLGSGMPISAMMAGSQVMTWPRGSHGSTFGGNPVACAVANATLRLIQDGLMTQAAATGAHLRRRLRALQSRHVVIRELRGLGLMLAPAFDSDATATAFERGCFARGLLVLRCGQRAVRLAPPMTVTEHQADTALRIMEAALADLE